MRTLRMMSQRSMPKAMLIALTLLFSIPLHAADLDAWLRFQVPRSEALMLGNISRSDTAKGAVVASTGHVPDYYYHWVRDAGLVTNVVVGLYQRAGNDQDRARYLQVLTDSIAFSRRIQSSSNRSGNPWDTGPGEPKFNVDGTPYAGEWGRPQNDGPAIRATAFIHLAHLLLDQGYFDWVKTNLYQASVPANTLIKADLEFVAHHWQDASFDLWEEVKGTHFYTQMVQRRALIEGADFAERMGDAGAAAFYRGQAQQIQQRLMQYWDAQRNYLVATLNPVNGNRGKNSGLDIAVVLGALHGEITHHGRQANGDDLQFSAVDDRVLLTALALKQVFSTGNYAYSINQQGGQDLGTAIGRYPEDTYDGYTTDSRGNPWFLATNALAEFYYKAANQYQQAGGIVMTQAVSYWIKSLPQTSRLSVRAGETITSRDPRFASILSSIRSGGDQFLKRSQYHSDSTGLLSEQMNRDTGYKQGAENLTWSYASLLTAYWARGH